MAEAPPGCCRTGASVCSHGDGDGDGVDRRTFVPEAAGRDRRARSEHGPATAGVPRGYRRGVRFRISLLLLLSALNLAALGAVLFVLLTPGALRDLLPEQIRTWHALHTVETLHQQLLVDAVRAGRTKERLAFPGEGFDHMEQVLVELLEEGYADLQPQLHDFRKAARLWYELGLPVPRDYQTVFPELQELAAPLQESDPPEQASGRAEDAGLSTPSTSPPAMEQEAPTMPAPADEPPAPSPGGPPSAARTNGGGGSEPPGPSLPAAVGQWAFDEVEGSYRQFRTMLTTLAASRLNRSPQLVRTAVGWLIMWSFLTALLYIYAARRLRTLISVPLEQLTEAAVAIGRGELRTPVAVPLRDDELGALGRAIEEMRDGLFRYVDQLREHGQRMQTLFDTMSNGVLLVDREGRVRQANACAAPLLGLPPGQLQGEPDVAALGIRALAGPLPAAGSEPPIEVTSTAEVGRGRAKHSRVFRRPLTTGEGRPAGYVAVIHDVTEEKEIEQIKNDFFSMVTHELKTPLTAVEGYSKLMLKGRPGPLTEDQRRFLQIITSQAEVLKQMIGDLLDVSRIAAGRLKLDPRPVQVASLLAGAQQRFAPQAAQQGIELCLQPPREQPDPTVRLDAPRIEQVLGNLLGNALKFTPEGGRICLSWGIDQGSFAFAVSDSGVGIPPGELPRIFDKFYQVDRVETRRAGGAGLGLYICREIVAAHGGTITAQGRVEGGTIFRVELPLDGLAPAGAGAEGEHR